MVLVLANYASCKICDREPDDKSILYTLTNLLPCDASAERGDATVSRPSVCP